MGYYAAHEAAEHGARLQTYTDVRSVIVENGAAAGVIARDVRDGHYYEIRGQAVVCTAGGIGSAGILTRSGIRGAGLRLFGDPSFGSTGLLPAGDLKSHFYEHGTSIAFMDDKNGCMYSTNITWSRFFWSAYQVMGSGLGGFWKVYKAYPRMVSIMNKIHDEGVGRVTYTGRVSKTLTPADEDKMNYCRYINEKILLAMGCERRTIKHAGFSHVKGGMSFGHPGGTCPMGVVVRQEPGDRDQELLCLRYQLSAGSTIEAASPHAGDPDQMVRTAAPRETGREGQPGTELTLQFAS